MRIDNPTSYDDHAKEAIRRARYDEYSKLYAQLLLHFMPDDTPISLINFLTCETSRLVINQYEIMEDRKPKKSP